MLTTGLSLHQGLLQNVERKTVTFDIHLGGCQTVTGTGGLEVHISQVVLVAEDIAEYSIFIFSGVLDETHGNAADRLLHGDASIHQSQRAGANGGH